MLSRSVSVSLVPMENKPLFTRFFGGRRRPLSNRWRCEEFAFLKREGRGLWFRPINPHHARKFVLGVEPAGVDPPGLDQ